MPENATNVVAPEALIKATEAIESVNKRMDSFVTKEEIKVTDNKIEELRKTLDKAVLAGGKRADPEKWNGFDGGAAWLKAVIDASAGNPAGVKIDEKLLKSPSGLNLATGPEGGYLLPPGFSTNIMDKVIGDSESLIEYCDSITIEGRESMTLLANAETSRADGSRWGGTQGYWKSEVKQMSGSKPTFREVRLEPHELYVMSYVTDKLLRNAPQNIEAYVARAAADEIAFKIGDAIFEGDGVGKPLGWLHSPCKITVAKETSQAADTVLVQNIRKMWNRMPVRSRNRAIWFAHIDVEPQLEALWQAVEKKDGSDNVGGVTWDNYYNAEKQTLKGRPIKYIEYAQTLGDEGDLMLVDPKSYVVGKRGTMNAAMSIHLRFDYAETAFRWIFEIDGQPYLNKPITPFHGTNTLSPIISLAAR